MTAISGGRLARRSISGSLGVLSAVALLLLSSAAAARFPDGPAHVYIVSM